MYATIMQAKTLKKFDDQIQRVKERLAALGPMRPGTLTRQYRKPQDRQGAFWQISYTHQMKSRSEYVRPNEVAVVRREIATFRRYKQLTAQWVELALRRSQTRLQQTRANSNLEPERTKKPLKTTNPSNGATNIPATD
jgi:hypothetical protein